jgi:pimeloyl-ACP methyl ester carboxylesterase
MPTPIGERFIEVDGIRILVRERVGEGAPTIFLHGNPTNSADWLPFLEHMEGPAIAIDLPGFGRSDRPDPGRFDYAVGTYGRLLDRIFMRLAPEGYRLVVHDWGVVGLVAAQHRPEALQRLVVINAVPLSRDYRWHWIARLWRRRGVGEVVNAINSRSGTSALLRLARPDRKPMPPEFVDMVWEDFDSGTGRAILRLYRSADPEVLEAAGEHLDRLDCPALVLWGKADPYISSADGRTFQRRLPRARFAEFDDAGHWPWIDRPEVIAEVVSFVDAPDPGP